MAKSLKGTDKADVFYALKNEVENQADRDARQVYEGHVFRVRDDQQRGTAVVARIEKKRSLRIGGELADDDFRELVVAYVKTYRTVLDFLHRQMTLFGGTSARFM